MAEHTLRTEPVTTESGTAVPRTAARLSFASAAAFAVLLVALHLAKPELDPSWHFISEYAIGRLGWMMVLAFLALSVSYVALFAALRPQPRDGGRRQGDGRGWRQHQLRSPIRGGRSGGAAPETGRILSSAPRRRPRPQAVPGPSATEA